MFEKFNGGCLCKSKLTERDVTMEMYSLVSLELIGASVFALSIYYAKDII